MNTPNEILKLKIMLQLLQNSEHTGTVTGLAQTLEQPKYTISRTVMALEADGMLEKPQNRLIKLTPAGEAYSARMEYRVRVVTSYLIRHGADPANAKTDADKIAISCSETLVKLAEEAEKIPAAKELFSQSRFSGSQFCKNVPNGNYCVAFTLRRSGGSLPENRMDAAEVNEIFQHPCTLSAENGIGRLHFVKNKAFHSRASSIGYLSYGNYILAESSGDIFTVPMAALDFSNQNEGLFYGAVLLNILCQDENLEAELTIYI